MRAEAGEVLARGELGRPTARRARTRPRAAAPPATRSRRRGPRCRPASSARRAGSSPTGRAGAPPPGPGAAGRPGAAGAATAVAVPWSGAVRADVSAERLRLRRPMRARETRWWRGGLTPRGWRTARGELDVPPARQHPDEAQARPDRVDAAARERRARCAAGGRSGGAAGRRTSPRAARAPRAGAAARAASTRSAAAQAVGEVVAQGLELAEAEQPRAAAARDGDVEHVGREGGDERGGQSGARAGRSGRAGRGARRPRGPAASAAAPGAARRAGPGGRPTGPRRDCNRPRARVLAVVPEGQAIGAHAAAPPRRGSAGTSGARTANSRVRRVASVTRWLRASAPNRTPTTSAPSATTSRPAGQLVGVLGGAQPLAGPGGPEPERAAEAVLVEAPDRHAGLGHRDGDRVVEAVGRRGTRP